MPVLFLTKCYTWPYLTLFHHCPKFNTRNDRFFIWHCQQQCFHTSDQHNETQPHVFIKWQYQRKTGTYSKTRRNELVTWLNG